jgi:hypothetical protein
MTVEPGTGPEDLQRARELLRLMVDQGIALGVFNRVAVAFFAELHFSQDGLDPARQAEEVGRVMAEFESFQGTGQLGFQGLFDGFDPFTYRKNGHSQRIG